MNTHCPASVRLLLAQWAHISSFYHTVGLHPSFTYTVGTTRAIYCTQTAQPHFLYYLHSGPIPPHFMTQWAYTHSFTYTVGTALAIYCTECPASLPPLLVLWAYTSYFYDTVGIYSPFTYTVGTILDIYCTQTVQPQFLPYLHSGPITPHFMQQWAYTPHFMQQ